MEAPDTNEPCEHLPWDSAFFGVKTARARAGQLTPESVREIDAWCAAQRVEWLYFLSRSDDPVTDRLAREAGYRLVDVRVTLEHRLAAGSFPATGEAGGAEPFVEADLPELQAIARTAFTESRYYNDGRVPREKCEALYVTWVTRSCAGAGDVLVVRDAGRAVGFVACEEGPEPGWGRIALIGVDAGWRGRGVGRRLIEAGLAWGAGRGLAGVIAVTQGRNVAAVRLYERAGFVTRSVGLYYHKWYA